MNKKDAARIIQQGLDKAAMCSNTATAYGILKDTLENIKNFIEGSVVLDKERAKVLSNNGAIVCASPERQAVYIEIVRQLNDMEAKNEGKE